MNPLSRPLLGCRAGLSISESEDSPGRGFPAWQVNRTTLQVVMAIFGQGAGVTFGHDWREDGVMEAIHGLAQQLQPFPDSTQAGDQPLLRNLLPWPDTPRLPAEDLKRLSATLRVEPAGLPAELRALGEKAMAAGAESPLYQYVRARGLTHLRHMLNQATDARICIGGRKAGFAGRYPGVIEEALFALQSRKPLFLTALLGGATEQLVDAIEGREMPCDFCPRTRVIGLYEEFAESSDGPTSNPDAEFDPKCVWKQFRRAGVAGISGGNGLSADENSELFHTRVLDRVLGLVLKGMARACGTSTQQSPQAGRSATN